MNKSVACCILILLLSFVSLTNRSFASYHFAAQKEQVSIFPQAASYPGQRIAIIEREQVYENEEEYKAESRIGSRPPNCRHKCKGCVPCDPIQMRTTTTHQIGLHIANYEPEGWKCKCGSFLYNP